MVTGTDCTDSCKSNYDTITTTMTPQDKWSEWVSDCCLFSNISAISWREQVHFQWDDDEVGFVLDQHAELEFFSVTHWNNSPRLDMSLHSETLFWFELTRFCSFSLMRRAYQLYSLWFDPTGTQTHDKQHSRRTRWPLRHRCGSKLMEVKMNRILFERENCSAHHNMEPNKWRHVF